MSEINFWEEEEQVERFAARDPDRRLLSLIERYPNPTRTRVLDIGCAGGRNAELLASRGFDVYAIDLANAMVQRTRERVASYLGDREATARAQIGRMEDLHRFASEDFVLIVALGIWHQAKTHEQWDGALSEAVRVLAPGGLLLVSDFSPRSDPTGEGIMPVPGEPHLYDGLRSGRHYLLDADEHDAEMTRYGLVPVEKTDTVVVQMEKGHRVTINGLYGKPPR